MPAVVCAPLYRVVTRALIVIANMGAGRGLGHAGRHCAPVVLDEPGYGRLSRLERTSSIRRAMHAKVCEGLSGVGGEIDIVVGCSVHNDAAECVLMILRKPVGEHRSEAESNREASRGMDA